MYSKENEIDTLERIADDYESGGCFCYFGEDTEGKEDKKWKFMRCTLIEKGVHRSSIHEVMPGELFYIRLLLEKDFIGMGGEHGRMYVHIKDEGRDEIKIYHSRVRTNLRSFNKHYKEWLPVIGLIGAVLGVINTVWLLSS